MISKFYIKNKKGLTLVELLITLVVLSLVILLAYSMFDFCNKTYLSGTKQYDLQNNIRIANNYITKQLRYAPVVKIMDTAKMNSWISSNSGILPYENFIYYNAAQKCIVHKNLFFTKSITVGKSGDIDFTSTTPYNELDYRIHGYDGSKSYDVEDKIYCLNVHLNSDHKITFDLSTGGETGKVIYYKSNDDFLADKLKPGISIDPDASLKNDATEFHVLLTGNVVSSCNISIPVAPNAPSVTIDATGEKICFMPVDGQVNNTIIFSLLFNNNTEFNYVARYNNDTGNWIIQ